MHHTHTSGTVEGKVPLNLIVYSPFLIGHRFLRHNEVSLLTRSLNFSPLWPVMGTIFILTCSTAFAISSPIVGCNILKFVHDVCLYFTKVRFKGDGCISFWRIWTEINVCNMHNLFLIIYTYIST